MKHESHFTFRTLIPTLVFAHGGQQKPKVPIRPGQAVREEIPEDVGQESFDSKAQLAAERASGAVVTHHQDSSRSGVNHSERELTHENVRQRFGKLFELPVDGQIYAQPLYVPGFVRRAPEQPRNVVVVATMKNNVYVFDADRPGPALWATNLGAPVPIADLELGINYKDVLGPVGILSTPYINLASGEIYLTSFTSLPRNGPTYRLFKLNLYTGETIAQRYIDGSVPGDGPDVVMIDGQKRIPFNGKRQLQRPAVTFHKGYIHLAFGGIGDVPIYHGWLFSYRASDLEGGPSWNATPVATSTDPAGAIWQSGQGLTLDERDNVYLSTGNGDFDKNLHAWGNSTLRLRFSLETGHFYTFDHFTPYNQEYLDNADLDVGSAGVLFIPPRFLISAGKTGQFYVMDRDNLGGYTPEAGRDAGAIQVFQASNVNKEHHNIHGAPIQWDSKVYIMAESDYAKAYAIDLTTGRLNGTPVSQSWVSAPDGMPGGFLALSVDDANPSSPILWVTSQFSGNANWQTRPGVLYGLNANDLNEILFSSRNHPGDDYGDFAKFCPPTVAGGKVFMATFSNKLVVYGLRN